MPMIPLCTPFRLVSYDWYSLAPYLFQNPKVLTRIWDISCVLFACLFNQFKDSFQGVSQDLILEYKALHTDLLSPEVAQTSSVRLHGLIWGMEIGLLSKDRQLWQEVKS